MPRVLLVIAVMLGTWTNAAHADDRDKALQLFEQSDRAYKAGQFEEAAGLLRDAYALYPEPLLLYNLGRAQEGLGDAAGAVQSYERYLQDAEAVKDRGAIERRIATLKAQLAKQEEDRRPDPPQPIDTRGPLEKYGPWITIGTGGAVVATGLLFGMRAQTTHDDALATPIQRDAAQLQASAERSATVANVLFVVGGAAIAGGITWTVLQWQGSDTSTAQVVVSPTRVTFEWVWR